MEATNAPTAYAASQAPNVPEITDAPVTTGKPGYRTNRPTPQATTSQSRPTRDPEQDGPITGTIPQGVSVNGISVGGMSAENARAALEQGFTEALNSVAITLKNEYFNSTLTHRDIGAYFDVDDALLEALAAPAGTEVRFVMGYSADDLSAALATLNDKVPGHATNATLSIEYDRLTRCF